MIIDRPVKLLLTADHLSHPPLTDNATIADRDLIEDTNIYVESMLDRFLTSHRYVAEFCEQPCADSPAQFLMGRCLRTTLTTLPENQQPAFPDQQQLHHTDRDKRWTDTKIQ